MKPPLKKEKAISTKQTRLERQLKQSLKNKPGTLRAEVAAEALEYDNIENFFTDLLSHGCQSGMVSSLIYYTDTHAFYDKHYDEIEALREELEEAFGEPLRVNGDLKNWYAWMAFEETARRLAIS